MKLVRFLSQTKFMRVRIQRFLMLKFNHDQSSLKTMIETLRF